jgi:hypothetical protein
MIPQDELEAALGKIDQELDDDLSELNLPRPLIWALKLCALVMAGVSVAWETVKDLSRMPFPFQFGFMWAVIVIGIVVDLCLQLVGWLLRAL